METSPLVAAHDAARKAFKAKSSTVATSQHEQAASEFRKIASETSGQDTKRTLLLLADHHQKLAQMLRLRASKSEKSTHEVASPQTISSAIVSVDTISQTPLLAHHPRPLTSRHDEQIPGHISRPARSVGSAITSNLASARGIHTDRQSRKPNIFTAPSTSVDTQAQTAEGTMAQRSPTLKQDKRRGTAASIKPNVNSQATGLSSDHSDSPQTSDTGFERFYSAFETVFSKISAPLAFAGLPLHPDANTNENLSRNTPRSSHRSSRRSSPTQSRIQARGPAQHPNDFTKLFSPATVRIIHDKTENQRTPSVPYTISATNESFYIVPPTAGTQTYSSILTRHLPPALTLDPEEEETYVDAQEHASDNVSVPTKTPEELHLENTALRSLLDNLSQRLYQFERSSQEMGAVALMRSSTNAGVSASTYAHGSMLDTAPTPTPIPLPTSISQTTKSSAPTSKLSSGSKSPFSSLPAPNSTPASLPNKTPTPTPALMPNKTPTPDCEADILRAENEKLQASLNRYKDRWERLKKGASARDRTAGKEARTPAPS